MRGPRPIKEQAERDFIAKMIRIFRKTAKGRGVTLDEFFEQAIERRARWIEAKARFGWREKA